MSRSANVYFWSSKKRIGKFLESHQVWDTVNASCTSPGQNLWREYCCGWSPLPELVLTYFAGTTNIQASPSLSSSIFVEDLGCYKDTTRVILRCKKREGSNLQVGVVGDTKPLNDHGWTVPGMRRMLTWVNHVVSRPLPLRNFPRDASLTCLFDMRQLASYIAE